MRKYLMIALAAFALFSCNKEREIVDCELQSKSLKYVFDVAEKPSFDGNTRAVKTSWEDGDQIFIVYDDVDPSKLEDFMILTYDGEEWKVTQEPATNKPKDTGGTFSALYCENPESSLIQFYDLDALLFEAEGNGQYMTGNKIPYTVEDETLTASIALDFENGDDMTYVQLRITDLPASTKGWTLEPDDYLHENENDFEVFLPAWLHEDHVFSHLSLSDVAGDGYEYRLGNRDDGCYLYLSVQQKADDITFTITNRDNNDKYRKTFSRKISGKCAAITFKGPQLDADGTPTNGWKKVPLFGLTFADSAVEKICVDNWDTNEDGYLSYTEAAAVTDLGTVFKDNPKITSFDELQFFTGLTSIPDDAFWYCKNLSSVVIPESVTAIGNTAFTSCSALASVNIPEGVKSIGRAAFNGCAFSSLRIPAGLIEIGEDAFSTIYGLTSIVVDPANPVYDSRDDSHALIETETNVLLRGCPATVIPNTVTSLHAYAFYGVAGVSSIDIPASVTTLGNYVFGEMSDLTSVYIPATVTSIGLGLFCECSKLTSIVVDSDNTVYDSRNGCNAIIETETNKLIAPCKTTVIPGTVTAIGQDAYSDNGFLEGEFVIPEGITSIGQTAFTGTLLESIILPSTLKEIGVLAFSYSKKLKSVTCLAETPPTCIWGQYLYPFEQNDPDFKIYVPAGSLEAYKAAEGWSRYPELLNAIE